MTNMSFFDVFKAPSFALVNSALQSNATGFENVENDTFVSLSDHVQHLSII